MSAPLTVADVLERAADLIEPEGAWTQHEYARGKSGRPVKTGKAAVCFCVMGAMSYASGARPADEGSSLAAGNALREAIGSSWITEWNDAPERTQAEVVSKLREAAALARERQA